ncbi:MAG: flagellar assembly protein FliW [Lachnospiraceae bacterium]|jgi:flagellar assembly factor FliW|nr:flagellar assembly protein FliW [Lachnospiraceae bacterium]MDD6148264.1 flagellar assembly protein FliW [Lachnospiraceae bacterium]MDY5703900.1 flagellar assembly protein FliW [Lachnospiraceae bacterium]MEE3357627.1 flagellar assembly protein FliW [Lachnospiraceae bacterium]HBE08863.1 flagellar assembly protein FliW [Lachnospiraceae bacterium]
MKVTTRLFGDIDIAEDKIIHMEGGIVGFPDLKQFTLIYDKEKGDDHDTIMWFQSLDEPQFAMPVLVPTSILPEYNPIVNDELLAPLGELNDDNLYCLVTVKVPSDLTKMTINQKAPIIINTDTMKGAQLIVENEDYEVRFPIYDILKNGKGEN